ncbi:MAG: hypothetical protein JWO02_2689 [Solirubrobacterales bacterium]|nr:hypothetical protein [Solirubrobacterales bacterium]
MSPSLRRLLLPAVLLLVLLALPGVASATPVACAGASADDAQGAVWTTDVLGQLEVDVTTTPIHRTDAYDHFGALFVNGVKYDAGVGMCDRVVNAGRGTVIRFPEVPLAGLFVRRSLTVRPLSVSAGHVVHAATVTSILRNATAAPVIVPVSIGEDSSINIDDLGSDATTQVLSTSSGDAVVGAVDDWAITADGPANAGAGAVNTDPVLLHAWGQPPYTGQDRADVVGVAPGNPDNWRTGWSSVTVPANGTISYTTLEGIALASDASILTGGQDIASAMQNGLLTPRFFFDGATLTVPEIAGSQNLQPPQPTLSGPAPDRAAVGEDVQLVLDAATDPDITQCAATTESLTYDGQVVLNANGRLTAPGGPAGSRPYGATTTNGCNQTRVWQGTVEVDGARTTCSRGYDAGDGAPLLDGTGAGYDPSSDGSLDDGGFLNPLETDSYDGLGQLTIGGAQYQPVANCTLEASGRLIRTAEQDVAGLQVTRTTYVPTGGPGARMAIILRNPGPTAVTVPVQFGTKFSLGSDGETTVVATGDGGPTPMPAARWMVTDDNAGVDDVPLAHVWDGAGGLDAADRVTLDDPGQVGDSDSYEVGYDNVTVGPGQTATYLLWEGQRRRTPRVAAERNDAVAAAQTLAGLSGAGLYGAMTAADIASVRNWARPAPTGNLSGPASGPTGTPQTFTASGVSGGAGTPQCGEGTVAWTVDEAAVAGGTQITPVFTAAGAHTVTATISGSCGAQPLVRSATFAAIAPGAKPVIVTPVTLSRLTLTGRCLVAGRKANVKVGAAVTGATTVAFKIQRLTGAHPRTCVTATSKAGKALLKGKAATSKLNRSGKVSKGKVSFTVPVTTLRSGTVKLVKGRLNLPRGAYRITLTSAKQSLIGLLIVR